MGKWLRHLGLGMAAIAASLAAWWFVVRGLVDPLAEGHVAYDGGRWEAAAQRARVRLKDSPSDRDALRLLARSEARAGRDRDAQRAFLKLGPNAWDAEDFLLMANGLLRQKHVEAAWTALLNGFKLDPSRPEILEQLARVSLGQGQPLASAGYARRLVDRPGWGIRGGLLLAEALCEARDPPGEAAALEQALRGDPSLAGTGMDPSAARKRWARSLLQLGRPAEARRALEASKVDRELDWLLSRAFLQERAIPEASAALARAVDFGDDDPTRPEPSPFAGASTCAGCHESIFRSQRASRHASTLARADELGGIPVPDGPVRDPALAKTEHGIRREGGGLVYETNTEDGKLRAIIDYAFGSGSRGRTFVGRDDSGRVRELRISSYAGGSVWDVTTGQFPHPARPEERLGRALDDDELRRCVGCHSSRTILDRGRPKPDMSDRGIGCEQCHGPGGNHLKAIANGFPDLAIAKPKHANARQIVELCGRCHGPPAGSPLPTGPIPARSQAPALRLSACYRESREALSCVTCHDPHRDVVRSPGHYEARCRSCHDPDRKSNERLAIGPTKSPPACPINPLEGCLGCHMPSVVGPTPHSAFSDHQIRIHHGPSSR